VNISGNNRHTNFMCAVTDSMPLDRRIVRPICQTKHAAGNR